MDSGKNRSSILKPQKQRNPLSDLDFMEDDIPIPTERLSTRRISMRRVSFASSNFVKEFATDPEKNTIWDTTYEELLSKSDHTHSSDNLEERSSKNMENLEQSQVIGNKAGSASISLDTLDLCTTKQKDIPAIVLESKPLIAEQNKNKALDVISLQQKPVMQNKNLFGDKENVNAVYQQHPLFRKSDKTTSMNILSENKIITNEEQIVMKTTECPKMIVKNKTILTEEGMDVSFINKSKRKTRTVFVDTEKDPMLDKSVIVLEESMDCTEHELPVMNQDVERNKTTAVEENMEITQHAPLVVNESTRRKTILPNENMELTHLMPKHKNVKEDTILNKSIMLEDTEFTQLPGKSATFATTEKSMELTHLLRTNRSMKKDFNKDFTLNKSIMMKDEDMEFTQQGIVRSRAMANEKNIKHTGMPIANSTMKPEGFNKDITLDDDLEFTRHMSMINKSRGRNRTVMTEKAMEFTQHISESNPTMNKNMAKNKTVASEKSMELTQPLSQLNQSMRGSKTLASEESMELTQHPQHTSQSNQTVCKSIMKNRTVAIEKSMQLTQPLSQLNQSMQGTKTLASEESMEFTQHPQHISQSNQTVNKSIMKNRTVAIEKSMELTQPLSQLNQSMQGTKTRASEESMEFTQHPQHISQSNQTVNKSIMKNRTVAIEKSMELTQPLSQLNQSMRGTKTLASEESMEFTQHPQHISQSNQTVNKSIMKNRTVAIEKSMELTQPLSQLNQSMRGTKTLASEESMEFTQHPQHISQSNQTVNKSIMKNTTVAIEKSMELTQPLSQLNQSMQGTKTLASEESMEFTQHPQHISQSNQTVNKSIMKNRTVAIEKSMELTQPLSQLNQSMRGTKTLASEESMEFTQHPQHISQSNQTVNKSIMKNRTVAIEKSMELTQPLSQLNQSMQGTKTLASEESMEFTQHPQHISQSNQTVNKSIMKNRTVAIEKSMELTQPLSQLNQSMRGTKTLASEESMEFTQHPQHILQWNQPVSESIMKNRTVANEKSMELTLPLSQLNQSMRGTKTLASEESMEFTQHAQHILQSNQKASKSIMNNRTVANEKSMELTQPLFQLNQSIVGNKTVITEENMELTRHSSKANKSERGNKTIVTEESMDFTQPLFSIDMVLNDSDDTVNDVELLPVNKNSRKNKIIISEEYMELTQHFPLFKNKTISGNKTVVAEEGMEITQPFSGINMVLNENSMEEEDVEFLPCKKNLKNKTIMIEDVMEFTQPLPIINNSAKSNIESTNIETQHNKTVQDEECMEFTQHLPITKTDWDITNDESEELSSKTKDKNKTILSEECMEFTQHLPFINKSVVLEENSKPTNIGNKTILSEEGMNLTRPMPIMNKSIIIEIDTKETAECTEAGVDEECMDFTRYFTSRSNINKSIPIVEQSSYAKFVGDRNFTQQLPITAKVEVEVNERLEDEALKIATGDHIQCSPVLNKSTQDEIIVTEKNQSFSKIQINDNETVITAGYLEFTESLPLHNKNAIENKMTSTQELELTQNLLKSLKNVGKGKISKVEEKQILSLDNQKASTEETEMINSQILQKIENSVVPNEEYLSTNKVEIKDDIEQCESKLALNTSCNSECFLKDKDSSVVSVHDESMEVEEPEDVKMIDLQDSDSYLDENEVMEKKDDSIIILDTSKDDDMQVDSHSLIRNEISDNENEGIEIIEDEESNMEIERGFTAMGPSDSIYFGTLPESEEKNKYVKQNETSESKHKAEIEMSNTKPENNQSVSKITGKDQDVTIEQESNVPGDGHAAQSANKNTLETSVSNTKINELSATETELESNGRFTAMGPSDSIYFGALSENKYTEQNMTAANSLSICEITENDKKIEPEPKGCFLSMGPSDSIYFQAFSEDMKSNKQDSTVENTFSATKIPEDKNIAVEPESKELLTAMGPSYSIYCGALPGHVENKQNVTVENTLSVTKAPEDTNLKIEPELKGLFTAMGPSDSIYFGALPENEDTQNITSKSENKIEENIPSATMISEENKDVILEPEPMRHFTTVTPDENIYLGLLPEHENRNKGIERSMRDTIGTILSETIGEDIIKVPEPKSKRATDSFDSNENQNKFITQNLIVSNKHDVEMTVSKTKTESDEISIIVPSITVSNNESISKSPENDINVTLELKPKTSFMAMGPSDSIYFGTTPEHKENMEQTLTTENKENVEMLISNSNTENIIKTSTTLSITTSPEKDRDNLTLGQLKQNERVTVMGPSDSIYLAVLPENENTKQNTSADNVEITSTTSIESTNKIDVTVENTISFIKNPEKDENLTLGKLKLKERVTVMGPSDSIYFERSYNFVKSPDLSSYNVKTEEEKEESTDAKQLIQQPANLDTDKDTKYISPLKLQHDTHLILPKFEKQPVSEKITDKIKPDEMVTIKSTSNLDNHSTIPNEHNFKISQDFQTIQNKIQKDFSLIKPYPNYKEPEDIFKLPDSNKTIDKNELEFSALKKNTPNETVFLSKVNNDEIPIEVNKYETTEDSNLYHELKANTDCNKDQQNKSCTSPTAMDISFTNDLDVSMNNEYETNNENILHDKTPHDIKTPNLSHTSHRMHYIPFSPCADDTQHLINYTLSHKPPTSDFSRIMVGDLNPSFLSSKFMPLSAFGSDIFPISLENTHNNLTNHDYSHCDRERAVEKSSLYLSESNIAKINVLKRKSLEDLETDALHKKPLLEDNIINKQEQSTLIKENDEPMEMSPTKSCKSSNISQENLTLSDSLISVNDSFAPISSEAKKMILNITESSNSNVQNLTNTCELPYRPSEEYNNLLQNYTDNLTSRIKRTEEFEEKMLKYYEKIKENTHIILNKHKSLIEKCKQPFKMPNFEEIESSNTSRLNESESVEEEKFLHVGSLNSTSEEKISTLKEKIEAQHKRSKCYWDVISVHDDECTFDTLYKTIRLIVYIDKETEIVNKMKISCHISENADPVALFAHKIFKDFLCPTNIQAAVGERFDLLTLLDYVYMNMQKILTALDEFDYYAKRYCLKMDKQFNINFKITNLYLQSTWYINVDLSDIHNITEDSVTSYAKVGTVKEADIKGLVRNCSHGLSFLNSFITSILSYAESEVKRKSLVRQNAVE